jgi:hypothetical protein
VKTVLLFLILSGFLATCLSNKLKQQMKIAVVLDVFSGRPNPSWELGTDESEDLFKQLSGLPYADTDKAGFSDGLGYRGFIITVTNTDSASASSVTYRVYKGFILLDGHVYSDIHSVEKQLIDQANARGFADIIKSLQIGEQR